MPKSANGDKQAGRCFVILISTGQVSKHWRGLEAAAKAAFDTAACAAPTALEQGMGLTLLAGLASSAIWLFGHTLSRRKKKTHACSESQHNLGSDGLM